MPTRLRRFWGVEAFENSVTDPLETIARLTYQWLTEYYGVAKKI